MEDKTYMKEFFLQFLNEENFFSQWLEGYELDCEIMDNEVELDEFFDLCETQTWVYNGCSTLALLDYRPNDSRVDVQRKYDAWREKNLDRWMELDDRWISIVGSMRKKN